MRFTGSERFVGKVGLAVGTALVLAACSGGGGGGSAGGSSAPGAAGTGVSAKPTATPTPTPTRAPYGPVLSASVDPVTVALAQVAGAKDLGDLDTVLGGIVTSAQGAAKSLSVADEPPGVTAARKELVAALTSLATDAGKVRSDIKFHDVCALSSAEAELGASQGLAAVSAALVTMTAAGYQTTFAVPPLPQQQSRALDNGTMVRKGKLRGEGVFKVENGGKVDAVVSLALNGKAVHSVFVGKGQHASVDGVEDGTYEVYVSGGADWDSDAKGFTQNCQFTKFEDTFPFETGRTATSWEITLQPVADGNAKTNDVDPNAFPQP
ncbi:hypothetical protein [Kitasatospora xanthocidica]|uniref:hypothetical protein n=1 Tax=Kitasatospora xanthocidica TaxID=83382 RepID=UPI0011C460E3|nr:hypothetical protein [Kitasatospora xanthocidica]